MKRYRFEAAIQRSTGWGAFVLFPHSAPQEFGRRGRIPVQVRFHGLPFSGSLMPHAGGYHRLAVPRTVLEALVRLPGELLEVELWEDKAPRDVEMPPEFDELLQREILVPPSPRSRSPAASSTATGSPRPSALKPASAASRGLWSC